VIVLTGTRQTGKTSTFLHLFPNYAFVSLDLATEAEQAVRNVIGTSRVTAGGVVSRTPNSFPFPNGFRAIPVTELG
jgi:hypothetical protein